MIPKFVIRSLFGFKLRLQYYKTGQKGNTVILGGELTKRDYYGIENSVTLHIT